ncbi:MAG: type II secretion system protein GspG [Capsulimonadaceae bacterium]
MTRRLRISISLVCGLSVSLFAIFASWKAAEHNFYPFNYEHMVTTAEFSRLDSSIAEYRAKTGRLPKSIRERDLPQESVSSANGWPLDGWNRPILYRIHGTTYTLLSYGRDGKPGGDGLDADVRSDRRSSNVAITMSQFLTRSTASDGLLRALTGGLAVSIAMFVGTRSGKLPKRLEWIGVVVFLIFMSLFSALMTYIDMVGGD